MSMYSDYKVGALSDVEFHNLCVEENMRERYNEEHLYDSMPWLYCQNDFNQDECMECASYEDCLHDVLSDD